MKIVHIETQKSVKKTKKELQKEIDTWGNEANKMLISEYKIVPSKEPTYIVEMSAKEIQLVSFYLELENRKPILNVEIDTEIKKEN
jgi:hypothetical protein